MTKGKGKDMKGRRKMDQKEQDTWKGRKEKDKIGQQGEGWGENKGGLNDEQHGRKGKECEVM